MRADRTMPSAPDVACGLLLKVLFLRIVGRTLHCGTSLCAGASLAGGRALHLCSWTASLDPYSKALFRSQQGFAHPSASPLVQTPPQAYLAHRPKPKAPHPSPRPPPWPGPSVCNSLQPFVVNLFDVEVHVSATCGTVQSRAAAPKDTRAARWAPTGSIKATAPAGPSGETHGAWGGACRRPCVAGEQGQLCRKGGSVAGGVLVGARCCKDSDATGRA